MCSICCQEQQVTTNRLARVGESICELPQARVFRQHQPKHTTVQIRWVPQFASPNFRSRAIRRSTRATLLVCHSVRAQDQQQFPYTAKHHRDSAAQSSIPSYCNFIEVPAALVLVQTVKAAPDRAVKLAVEPLIHNTCLKIWERDKCDVRAGHTHGVPDES